MQFLQPLKPIQPSNDDWYKLSQETNQLNPNANIDIIIPVYGAPNDTLRCIYSVINTHNEANYNLVVIEDGGPDEQLREKLKELKEVFQFTYLENEENLGFILTCNRGFALNKTHDVILLNSDTEVFDGWIDKIMACSQKNPKAGTITAMSNNAEICSYPFFCQDYSYPFEINDSKLNEIFKKTNDGQSIVVPTGVGFCMYIRRACLEQIGYFNYELFGKGYGEENDLCVRAENAGWQNLIATDVFVRHYGSSSFSGTVRQERVKHALKTLDEVHPQYQKSVHKFIQKDPMKPYLKPIDQERLVQFLEKRTINNQYLMLQITHDYGGGTEKHHQEITVRLVREGISVISIKPNSNNGIGLFLDGKYPLPNLDIDIQNYQNLENFLLNDLNIDFVHIQHLKGYDNNFVRNLVDILIAHKIPYYFTTHDYYPICPRITLTNDDTYCGEPTDNHHCNQCIKSIPETTAFNHQIDKWRDNYAYILSNAKTVFCPNDDVKWRFQRYFSGINIKTMPHFDAWTSNNSINKKNIYSKKRIGIIGAIGAHKGFYQIHSVAKYCMYSNIDIEFVIIGYSCDDKALQDIGNIEILGKYSDDTLIQIIHESNLDAIWFPNVWPETYSYTLSASLATGLPIIAYDFGAVSQRLKEHNIGILIPIEIMLNPIEVVKYFLSDLSQYQFTPITTQYDYDSIKINYYNL